MYKKGFTLIELIASIFIIAIACCITSTSYVYSVKQRIKSRDTQQSLQICSAILNCLKSKGSMGIKSIYYSSPRSSKGEASWYICFDTMEEIKSIIYDMKSFPGYCAYTDLPSADKGKRYTAFISISSRMGSLDSYMEYPVRIQLIDSRQDGSLPLRMDYEFISGL